MEQALDRPTAESAVLGGALLGGGGGGKIAHGLQLAQQALSIGTPCLISCADLSPDDVVVTVSAVGAPAANISLLPVHYCRAVTLLQEHSRLRIAGLISSENGAIGTVNGWVQSALLQIPVVDAPCDGRAHPTGVMGSLGLHKDRGYISLQSAVGQEGLELVVRGPLDVAASLVRQAAVQTGGMVAVARNPVSVRYVQEHGALGAIRQAIALGQAMIAARPAGGRAVVDAVARELGGCVYGPGVVESVTLITERGFDHGAILLLTYNAANLELTFWNEYMTLEQNGQRLATFPDLISTIGMDGIPCSSAEVVKGQQLYVLTAPYERLILGSGVRDLTEYRRIEGIIQKPIVPYLQANPGFLA